MDPIALADGLVLRSATEADIDAIAAMNVDAFGEQDGPDVRTFLAQPATRRTWSVVADGERVVSSIGRIDHALHFDGLNFPAAQIEYVSTDADYQRRGLVAAQIDWHHRWCAEAGIPVQFIGGIPYFYRRFGYGYGLSPPTLFLFDKGSVSAAHDGIAGVLVRDATEGDVDALVRLEALRRTDGLRVVRDANTWHRMVTMCDANKWAHLLVAEAPDGPQGWALVYDHSDEPRAYLLPSVAATAEASTALVRVALDRAGEHLLVGFDSPGSVFGEQLRALGSPFEYGLGYYVRIPDPVAFIELLRPILEERLGESELADASGSLEISLYTTGIAVDYEHGAVTGVRAIEGVEDPTDHDGIGVAPDWFPALALGRWGACELARRVDDVIILRDRKLMDVLFPQRASDVAADF